MTRRMSCWLTKDQVRARSKTVTRRRADTWMPLKPGDRLVLVEKAQGLKAGDRHVVLAEVEIVDIRVEPLHLVDEDECIREGFPDLEPSEFCEMWMESHGYRAVASQTEFMAIQCRRIEWRYLDDEQP